jgi:PKD repeat protein
VGGSIRFGADGKLYFAVGDNGYSPNAQNLSNPHGKILRINKDGTIPTDNPFYGQAGKLPEIWAYGLRNSWRFQFDGATGQLYAGEAGDFTWEEVNRIVKGGNYGWPLAEGKCTTAICPYIDPVYAYNHDGLNAAITGGPVYQGAMFPAEYKGRYFFGDYVRGFIRTLTFDANGNSAGAQDFDAHAGSVVDLKTAPDGSLWYINFSPGQLRRITYNPNSHLPVPNATADKQKGMAPMTVHFSSAGTTDPDGDSLAYDWDFGDGTRSTAANPVKTYPHAGRYIAQLKVSDGANTVPAVPLIIQTGLPPTVGVSTTANDSRYRAGDEITYTASALDGAGFDLNDAAISTDVIFHHGTHTHPFLDNLIGRAHSFTIPDTGEAAHDTWYEIKTTATDQNGLQATKSIIITPRTSKITLNSKPSGPQVFLDGRPTSTPLTFTGVEGFRRELSAPTRQLVGKTWYDFRQWSDGGSQRHTVHTPKRDTTYTAKFARSGSFKARYFDNPNLSGRPKITREDANIDFFWGNSSPGRLVSSDHWSARWTKNQFFAGGQYRFTAVADDGVRLYIDGRLRIDQWHNSSATSHSADINLSRGHHTIKLEYFDDVADSIAKLSFDLAPAQPDSLLGRISTKEQAR